MSETIVFPQESCIAVAIGCTTLMGLMVLFNIWYAKWYYKRYKK